ncbi:hypothetical protein [Streptomyces sp. NPDC058193]|uniref:hypothetical protein n=1 Tax=Streptomyces sp. NPDC058193 TaxID=3346373 RepID=UPI0036EAE056
MSKMIEEVVEQLWPEASYVTLQDGRRTCLMVFDMQESAQVPPLLDPLSHTGPKIPLVLQP